MKSLLCLLFVSVTTTCLFAQNKTLGVGTPSPNPNAALHVESPTNNQGILIPRLSTTQRAGLSAALAVADVGLIVFDTEVRALAIWNGTGWDIGSKVGAPIAIDNNLANGNAATFVNSNAANNQPALVVNTSGSGNALETTGRIQAGQFIGNGAGISNVMASSVSNNGVTSAAISDNEIIDSDIKSDAAISGSKVNPNFGTQNIATTGTITASSFTGNGSGLTNLNAAAVVGSLSLAAGGTGANSAPDARTNLGLGSLATLNSVTTSEVLDGTISNADINNLAAIDGAKIFPDFGAQAISTTGTVTAGSFLGDGSGLTGLPGLTLPVSRTSSSPTTVFDITSTGTAGAGAFGVSNTSSGAPALQAANSGIAPAGIFSTTNPANNQPAVQIIHAGTGNALTANRPIQATQFIGDGSALTGVTATPPVNSVGTSQVIDGALTNADISVAAAIAGTKISPDFGGQNIVTIGNISGNGGGLTNLTATALNGVVPLANGGTGSNNAAAARTNLGLGPLATLGGIGSSEVTDGSIINVDIGASAAISGTKITPNFGAQNIVTTGTVTAASFSGDGSLLTGVGLALPFSQTLGTGANAFGITNTGATGNAANFSNTNTSNPNVTLAVSNNGTAGGALHAFTTSAPAARLQISNPSSPYDAMIAQTDGLGPAGLFLLSNASNASPAINIQHSGTGNAITANRPIQATQFIGDGSLLTNLPNFFSSELTISTNGTGQSLTVQNGGTGRVASFNNINASSFLPVLAAENAGTGTSGFFRNSSNAGTAGEFIINNLASPVRALSVRTNGTGRGIELTLDNVANNSAAINISHLGTGNAITANRPIQATQFIGDGSQLTNILPAGLILPFGGAAPPSGYLLCNGAAVSRTTYAALFAAIGTSWGIGDGATTFNLPDLRGRFLRGVDGAAGNDPDAVTRTATNGGNSGNNVGSIQGDELRSHTHELEIYGNASGGNGGTVAIGDFTNFGNSSSYASGGSETRPKNANVNYVIKF